MYQVDFLWDTTTSKNLYTTAVSQVAQGREELVSEKKYGCDFSLISGLQFHIYMKPMVFKNIFSPRFNHKA